MIPKFRAWHKKEKKMYYIDKDIIITFRSNGNWRINKDDWNGGCLFWNDDGILMQSTGLKDKNGKEIFEGDVVKTFRKIGKGWIESHVEGNIVKYSNITAKWYPYNLPNVKKTEVIGNIHENPELLKGGKGYLHF